MSFFVVVVPGFHPGSNMAFSHYIALGSTWLWEFPCFITFPVLRRSSQVFCSMSLNGYFPDVFLMVELGLWVYGRKITEAKCHSHCIILSTWSKWLVSTAVNLGHLAWGTVGQITSLQSYSFFFSLPILCSLVKKSHYAQPTLKEWELCSSNLRVENLYESCLL